MPGQRDLHYVRIFDLIDVSGTFRCFNVIPNKVLLSFVLPTLVE